MPASSKSSLSKTQGDSEKAKCQGRGKGKAGVGEPFCEQERKYPQHLKGDTVAEVAPSLT